MCGITGAAWTEGGPAIGEAVLVRMTDALAHRGPDDAGYHSAAGVALGHRRLSIIDLGGGHQPLANEDGTVWIVFNGEVYNYQGLAAGLAERGHQFRSVCDTEVIVHLYEERGPECVHALRGMFAFALWDANRRRLLLARDRLGKKPLIYRREPQRVLFASELKSLLQVPGLPRTVRPQAVDQYLTYQYVPHPHSILEGFEKLPPAHWATFDADGAFETRRYWTPPCAGDAATEAGGTPDSPAAWRERLRTTLTEAVRLRLRSDVPLGAFLSGGIDSTIITGLMQQLSSRPVQTFSIGFPVKAFDERSFAREAAAHLGTDHHEEIVEPSALAILPKLVWHYDEPFADSSAIPTMLLSQMTRRNVTVALSGDGGDELFAGYERYQAVRLAGYADRLPGFVRRLLGARLWQRIPASVAQRSRRRRLKRLLAAIQQEPQRRYLDWVSIFNAERRFDLYTDEFRARLSGADAGDFLLAAYADGPRGDFVSRTTRADLLTYLPCDILTKVDIASMAAALECRCPFLDHEVVELAMRMPIELKQRGRSGKQILKDTFADLLPSSIQKRGKMGFGVPLDHWFRGELRPWLESVLLDPSTLRRGYFRPERVERLVTEHVRGEWDHSARLWSLLCLELWERTFVDPSVVPTGPAAI